MPNFTEVRSISPEMQARLKKIGQHVEHRLPVRLAPVEQGSMPVRFTPHEAIIWYRLADSERTSPEDCVAYQEFLTLGWGKEYLWHDPDPELRQLNRDLLRNVIYIMRRLLLANGDHVRIVSKMGEGLRLARKE